MVENLARISKNERQMAALKVVVDFYVCFGTTLGEMKSNWKLKKKCK